MSRLKNLNGYLRGAPATADQPKLAVNRRHSSANLESVLADKKIGGHLPNCQRAIPSQQDAESPASAEPRILANSRPTTRWREQKIPPEKLPKTEPRRERPGSLGNDFPTETKNNITYDAYRVNHQMQDFSRQFQAGKDVYPHPTLPVRSIFPSAPLLVRCVIMSLCKSCYPCSQGAWGSSLRPAIGGADK